jgi:putative ABC transport system permease protein
MVLLVGSGLMVKGFWKLMQVNPGFSSEGLLTMTIALPSTTYANNQSAVSFWSRLEEKAKAIPGVQSAALVSGLPPIRRLNANDTAIEGLVPGPNSPTQNVDYWQAVTPGYFETVKAQLIEGRFLDGRDGDGSALTVVINQSMARHFYGNESPIGRRISTNGGGPNPPPVWRTIVGVIADIKNAGMDKPAGTELYMPYSQVGFPYRNFSVVLRTSGDPLQLSRAATEAVHSLDPSLPVSSIRTMDDVIATAESRPRFLTLLLGLFSGLAMALAAVGIYGVMAYSVTQRTQEIGIRMALGAKPTDVLGMVVKNGMLLTAIGMAVGLGAALGLTRLMRTLLFGVTATDAMTFVTVPLVLVVIALIACYIPARRATRVDPLIALRYD